MWNGTTQFKKQNADVLPYSTKNKGWGLRTKQPLSALMFVIEYVGEAIDVPTCDQRARNWGSLRRK